MVTIVKMIMMVMMISSNNVVDDDDRLTDWQRLAQVRRALHSGAVYVQCFGNTHPHTPTIHNPHTTCILKLCSCPHLYSFVLICTHLYSSVLLCPPLSAFVLICTHMSTVIRLCPPLSFMKTRSLLQKAICFLSFLIVWLRSAAKDNRKKGEKGGWGLEDLGKRGRRRREVSVAWWMVIGTTTLQLVPHCSGNQFCSSFSQWW